MKFGMFIGYIQFSNKQPVFYSSQNFGFCNFYLKRAFFILNFQVYNPR